MIRGSMALILALALTSCRAYDFADRISDTDGLTPGDQFARYGREQAQAVAIGRRFGEADAGSALAHARNLPDVASAVADSQSYWLTVDFKSGWRLGIVPIDDGEAPADTPNLPAPGER